MLKRNYNFLCGTVTWMIFFSPRFGYWIFFHPGLAKIPLTSAQLHLHRWCYKSERDLITIRRDRSLSPYSHAFQTQCIGKRVPSSGTPWGRTDPHTTSAQKESLENLFRQNTSSSEAGCPIIVPRKGCPRKWLFIKRQLISRSVRTACLLYSTKENIKLCWQYTTDIRYDGLQPGTCLTEEMVQC